MPAQIEARFGPLYTTSPWSDQFPRPVNPSSYSCQYYPAPDDGSGGSFVLLWARPRGLTQSGDQLFTPVEVSTSPFSVTQQGLPPIHVVTVPEHDSFVWILVGLAIWASVKVPRMQRRKANPLPPRVTSRFSLT